MSGTDMSRWQGMKIKLRGWWRHAWEWLKQYTWWVLVAVVFVCVAVLVTYQQKKTLWDLLQLLVVPAALAGAGLWFTRQQTSRQSKLAEDKRHEDLLAAYLEAISDLLRKGELLQMSGLLLKGELRQKSFGRAQGQGPIIARARTLATLRGLDGRRKGELVQFLYEASLIISENHIIDLAGANLSGAILAWAFLAGADLTGANLSEANLADALLTGAYLSMANLSEANLTEAFLTEANLSMANLTGADLTGAYLSVANLSVANLTEANLSGTHLSRADLSMAHLTGAYLTEANLSMADLTGADLRGADLTGADLRGATYNKREHFGLPATQWPTDFNPDKAGAMAVEDEEEAVD